MRIVELLKQAEKQLRAAGIQEAALEAELIVQHVVGCSRAQLYLLHDSEVTDRQLETACQCIQQRSKRIPFHHITGSKEFWSLDFFVGPDVLIPRPETEFLLDRVCAQVHGEQISCALDLCTGSGVIAVVLALEYHIPVIATDLSTRALQIAQQNIVRHHCSEKVSLLCSDLFSGLCPEHPFDLIVTNPPYVALADKESLAPEVVDYDPHLALFGGEDGLQIIRSILSDAHRYLTPGGRLFMEIGADQGAAALHLATESGEYTNISLLKDWSGRDRVIAVQRIG